MAIPGFPALIQSIPALVRPYTDDELREKLRTDLKVSEALAVIFFHRATAALDERPPADARLNPYALSLDPARWEFGRDARRERP